MNTLALTFVMVSQAFQLPQGLLSAVCFVESKHVVKALNINDGGSSSYGACQIKLATAQFVGYKGTEKELHNPQVNIYYAGKYLRHQLNRYDNDILKSVAAYNAGTHRINAQGLTMNRKYVGKVFSAWSENR